MDTPFCSFFSYAPLGSEKWPVSSSLFPSLFSSVSFSFACLRSSPSPVHLVVVQCNAADGGERERVYKNMHATELRQGLAKDS